MTPNDWFKVVVAILTLLGALTGALVAMAFRIGRVAEKIASIGADFVGLKTNADRVPVLETRTGMLEKVWERTQGDLRELRHKTGNPSVPDFNAED